MRRVLIAGVALFALAIDTACHRAQAQEDHCADPDLMQSAKKLVEENAVFGLLKIQILDMFNPTVNRKSPNEGGAQCAAHVVTNHGEMRMVYGWKEINGNYYALASLDIANTPDTPAEADTPSLPLTPRQILGGGSAYGTADNVATLLAAERACGFRYDQTSLQVVVTEAVPENDANFSSTLNLILSVRTDDEAKMETSQRTIMCAQEGRIANNLHIMAKPATLNTPVPTTAPSAPAPATVPAAAPPPPARPGDTREAAAAVAGKQVEADNPKVPYVAGWNDRQAFETWLASLTGMELQGAGAWAARRSDKPPLPKPGCPPSSAYGAEFAKGCQEAKAMLDADDKRRITEAEYRRGWNEFAP